MSSIHKSLQQLTTLEDLANRNSFLHRTTPSVKIIITLIYIISVISFPSLNVGGLILFSCIPVFLMIVSEIPLKPLLIRCSVALPFAFFAGLSNVLLDRKVIIQIGLLGITEGTVSLLTLCLKTILTVMAVLLLVASTGMNEILYALIGLHMPSLLVIQIMMTYRYMSVLFKEASLMYHAYLLRAPKEKGIRMRDMGTFLGHLLLRSIDRAERIYQAMQCRGFDGHLSLSKSKKLGRKDWGILAVAGILLILLRVCNFRLR